MKSVKKITVVFMLCFTVILGSLIPATAAETKVAELIGQHTGDMNAVMVFDLTNKHTLYSKNENEKIAVASTTKIVTALVALKYLNPDHIITVGNEIRLTKPNSSLCYISVGQQLKLRTLIAAMLLPSGNDAAYTVAVNVAKIHSGKGDMSNSEAVSYFCNLMNNYARELNCNNTFFVNPEGWDNYNHYSTVADMTTFAIEAMNNSIISSIANIHSNSFTFYSGEWIRWNNTNELINPNSKYYYPYAHGMKTGTTNMAGKCLIANAEKDGRTILILAYGCTTEDVRFGKVRDIFELVYSLPVLGDIDQDGVIAAADARLLLRASVGLEEITPIMKKRGDTDNDGNLTALDARKVLRAAVGLETLT